MGGSIPPRNMLFSLSSILCGLWCNELAFSTVKAAIRVRIPLGRLYVFGDNRDLMEPVNQAVCKTDAAGATPAGLSLCFPKGCLAQ